MDEKYPGVPQTIASGPYFFLESHPQAEQIFRGSYETGMSLNK